VGSNTEAVDGTEYSASFSRISASEYWFFLSI
jgi:hypothetical protein